MSTHLLSRPALRRLNSNPNHHLAYTHFYLLQLGFDPKCPFSEPKNKAILERIRVLPDDPPHAPTVLSPKIRVCGKDGAAGGIRTRVASLASSCPNQARLLPPESPLGQSVLTSFDGLSQFTILLFLLEPE